MGITSPNFSGGSGAVTSTKVITGDLEVDSGTLSVDEVNNRVGVGTTTPGVQLDVHDTTTSSANTGGALRLSANDGAVMGDSHRLGVIEFTGAEDSSGTQTVGARIEVLTEAAWTNAENGAALYFYTTDGNASQTNVLKLDSNKKATFAGDAQITGDIIIDDGGSLKEAGGTAAITFDASGQVTTFNIPAAAVAQASDHIIFLDGGATGAPKAESIDDFLTAIAGSGISVSSSQLTAAGGAAANDASTILHMSVFA